MRNGELDGVSLIRFEGVDAIALRHGLGRTAGGRDGGLDYVRLNAGVGTCAVVVGNESAEPQRQKERNERKKEGEWNASVSPEAVGKNEDRTGVFAG